MALKDSIKHMHELLHDMQVNLEKAEKGNKAAAQRVRTDSIHFQKVAKMFRKESVQAEKKGLVKKKPTTKKAAAKKTTRKTATKKATKKTATKKTKKKTATKKTTKRKR